MDTCIVDEAYLATWSARWLSGGPGPQRLTLQRLELAQNPALCQAVERLLRHRRGLVRVSASALSGELQVEYLAALWGRSDLTREITRAVDTACEQSARPAAGSTWT